MILCDVTLGSIIQKQQKTENGDLFLSIRVTELKAAVGHRRAAVVLSPAQKRKQQQLWKGSSRGHEFCRGEEQIQNGGELKTKFCFLMYKLSR